MFIGDRRRLLAAMALIAMLLALFAGLSYSAIRAKSATYDEPGHALGAFVQRFDRDYRVTPEDPPLFGWWAMLPHGRHDLNVDLSSRKWLDIPQSGAARWPLKVQTLYQTPGNDPDRFLNRTRIMFLLIGVAMGGVLAAWAWKLGGALAAVIVATLYCFDPNFLGHVPLVGSDVLIAFLTLLLMMCLWAVGRQASWTRLAALALLCCVGPNVKLSGLLFGPIVALVLLDRALLPTPWVLLGKRLTTRLRRIRAVIAVCISTAVVAIGFTWACYGFRFSATPDPSVRLETRDLVRIARYWAWYDARPGTTGIPGPSALDQTPTPPVARATLFGIKHRILPEAWLYGLLYTATMQGGRDAFLLGHYASRGWWYYFPVAMLVKTPSATLLAGAIVLGLWAWWRFGRRRRSRKDIIGSDKKKSVDDKKHARDEDLLQFAPMFDRWTSVCVAAPIVVFGLVALNSHTDIGLRHLFPIYPFLYLLIALGIARMIRTWPKWGGITAGGLCAALLLESLMAYPNYIAFFNTPAGGSRGGLQLLSDSSLDWGQDLPLLSDWQHRHPQRTLYLCYFGLPDPVYYGIHFTNLPGGVAYGPNGARVTSSTWPTTAGPGGTTLAISATNLQGTYLDDSNRARYAVLRAVEPNEVLGGTIYLYDLEPTPPAR